MRKLDFIFFDAGGGHRSAANALKMVIEREERPWDVRLVNLQELLDQLDVIKKLTGVRVQDQYNRLLASGLTLGSTYLIPPLQTLIRLLHRKQVKLLKEFWSSDSPDLVVSLIPHFNRAMFLALKAASPRSEFVTVLTDLADYPPHFWLERQEQYVVCGTEKAAQQAYHHGYPPERVFRTSGMILHPKFYDPVEMDPKQERRSLGLDPDKPTGLVLFGGHGSRVMAQITRLLDASGLDLQLILICGHNKKLRARLNNATTRIPKFVEGFTREIPYYMHISDFFIGKPGPGSVSEALSKHLPVIVEGNAWTLPQERYNTDWVREQGVGLVVDDFKHVASAVRQLLAPGAYETFRGRAASLNNRAVFEIPEILERILSLCDPR
jgi:1,2-diacylglycerol 3-beta-galactosyltransferase